MKKKIVCIVGLGYVGLPLALLCLKRGYKVIGFDIDKKKIDLINNKLLPIKDEILINNFKNYIPKLTASSNPEVIKTAEILVVCVPTPIDDHNNPDLTPLKNAINTISKNLSKDKLIIIESTIYPGVMEDIVKPILEKEYYKIGKNIFLSHCPERIDPGNKKWDIEYIPRVFGSFSKKGANKTKEFYESILKASVKKTSSIKVAEAIKIVENTFRDVNIALVNELAKSFEKLGIDIVETINGAATKPFAFMAHYPGCGVGGHCIPVDPYYLIDRGKEVGFEHRFLSLTRSINNSMPRHTIFRCIEGLNEIKRSVSGTKIAILGLSYKKNIDDTRNSPSYEIIKLLKQLQADIIVYDPYKLNESNVSNLEEALNYAECLIIVTNHDEFKRIKPDILKMNKIKVVIDGRNILDKNKIIKSGITYKGIGR